jgi:CBS domain-containing protein
MNLKVSSIMSTQLITVNESQSMKDVEDIFRKYNYHHIPVIGEEELRGIISYSDYLLFKRGFNDYPEQNRDDLFRLKTHKVEEVMVRNPTTLTPNDNVSKAVEIFKKNHFHSIPITIDQTLTGLITTYDMIIFFEKKLNQVYDGYKNLW